VAGEKEVDPRGNEAGIGKGVNMMVK